MIKLEFDNHNNNEGMLPKTDEEQPSWTLAGNEGENVYRVLPLILRFFFFLLVARFFGLLFFERIDIKRTSTVSGDVVDAVTVSFSIISLPL